MKRLLPALLSLLALLSLPMYGQESVIKLTTHMKPTDRFNISIKCDGTPKVVGASGMESGGSPRYDGSVNYQLSVKQPELTITGTNITLCTLGQDSIYSLDITGCPTLEELTCPDNYLTEIDLSKSVNMKTLVCYNNDITSLDLSACPKLYQLDCNANPVAALDLKANSELVFLTCGSTKVQKLDLSGCTKLEELIAPNTSVEEINLTGLAQLTKVICNQNGKLRKLTLAGNTALSTLEASDCAIEQIDISDATALTYLTLGNNQLSTFTASNPSVESIDLRGNKLQEITLPECKNLQVVTLYNNLIKGAAMTAFMNSLPEAKKSAYFRAPKIELIATDNPQERNICLVSDVKIATDKGWEIFGNEEATSTVSPYAGAALYPVKLEFGQHGKAQLTGADNLTAIPERTELKLTMTPDEGYVVDRVYCNHNLLEVEGNELPIVVRGETLVEVFFKDPTSIQTIQEGATLKLFPTVADQLLTVTGLMPQEQISIYSISGVCLATIEADTQGTATVELSAYPSGDYLLQHQGGATRFVVKH